MTFNPQELNQRITLQQKFTSRDPETGLRSDEWQDRQEVFAKAEPAVGRTRFAAAAAGFVDPVDFTVRYIEVEGDSGDQGTIPLRPGDWRVVWRGYAYEVQSIKDNKGKRRELIIATEGKGENG